MARGQLHLSPEGPAPCGVTTGTCPYEDGGHYNGLAEAEAAYAESQGGSLPRAVRRKAPQKIALDSNLGSFEVIDGDLSDPAARTALSTGLCGDLALAIHRKTGGAPYFLSYSFHSEEELAEAFAREPNVVFTAAHVVLESSSHPGSFLDSHGHQDLESLEEVYEDAVPVRGTAEMLQHFANSQSADRLGAFADSALELDRLGERYDSELDELSWDDDDEEEDLEDE